MSVPFTTGGMASRVTLISRKRVRPSGSQRRKARGRRGRGQSIVDVTPRARRGYLAGS